MKIKNYIDRIFIFCLVILLVCNSIACLKRVPLPLDNPEVELDDTIYVILKSGIKYKLNRPKFERDYLRGIYRNRKIKISLDDIHSIEVVRLDKKKITKGVIIAGLAIFILFVIGYGTNYPTED